MKIGDKVVTTRGTGFITAYSSRYELIEVTLDGHGPMFFDPFRADIWVVS